MWLENGLESSEECDFCTKRKTFARCFSLTPACEQQQYFNTSYMTLLIVQNLPLLRSEPIFAWVELAGCFSYKRMLAATVFLSIYEESLLYFPRQGPLSIEF